MFLLKHTFSLFCYGNNKKIKWLAAQSRGDRSPQSCSDSAVLWPELLLTRGNVALKWPRMCFWQRSTDIAKLSSCCPDVTKCIKSGREQGSVRFDGFLISAFLLPFFSPVQVPGPAPNLQAVSNSPTSVSLSWDKPVTGNGEILTYKLYYTDKSFGSEQVGCSLHQLSCIHLFPVH